MFLNKKLLKGRITRSVHWYKTQLNNQEDSQFADELVVFFLPMRQPFG